MLVISNVFYAGYINMIMFQVWDVRQVFHIRYSTTVDAHVDADGSSYSCHVDLTGRRFTLSQTPYLM